MCGFEGTYPYARVAQLVEYDLAKVGVAGSSPVSRSDYLKGSLDFSRLPFLIGVLVFVYFEAFLRLGC